MNDLKGTCCKLPNPHASPVQFPVLNLNTPTIVNMTRNIHANKAAAFDTRMKHCFASVPANGIAD